MGIFKKIKIGKSYFNIQLYIKIQFQFFFSIEIIW